MAAAYDDDSTDDEIGMNLQLAERLNIRRGEYPQSSSDHHYENSKDYKQYFNSHMQRHLPDSSSGVDSHNDCSYSTMHGPYIPPNKKRQSGDKSLEQFANPKRTCLNGRYPNGADCPDSNKYERNDVRYNGSKYLDSMHQHSEQSTSNQGLHPDKTYEDHLNNLADAEDSDFDLSSKFSYRIKDRLKQQNSKVLPNHSISCISGVCPEPHLPYQSVTRHGVQFIESGSDEDSKTTFRNGALKGGRQSPDFTLPKRKVIGRKGKKVLDSDDSDDERWESAYRSRPLVFSSSDSEDSSQKRVHLSETSAAKHHANHSFSRKHISPHCDHHSSRRQKSGMITRHRRSPTKSSHHATSSFKSQNFSGDGASSQFHASVTVPPELHGRNTNKLCRSHRSSRSTRPTSVNAENTFVSNMSPPSSSTRSRNQAHGNARWSGISGSAHSKVLHSHRQSGAKGARNRSLSSSRSRREKADFAAAYPEFFEGGEDSSEVEFFTANSYSDTEASNESLRGLTISTFLNTSNSQNNSDIICEHSVNIASSEDEISVVFSTVPHSRNSESRRNGRALGRRGRGAVHRHFQNNQEVVSVSPDPVEQVRQMEEDERFARMLQAEFDAELNAPVPSSFINFENWTESDDSIIDPVGGSESEEPFDSLLPFVQRIGQVHRRGQRLSNRVSFNTLGPPTGIFGRRRTEGRNRRLVRPAIMPDEHPLGLETNPWQIARWFGINANAMQSNIFPAMENSGDNYEALLRLSELNGDVPRGLQRSEINRLPTRQFRGSKIDSSENVGAEVSHHRTELNKECQVCLSDYVAGDVLRILPCFHEFHTPCIDPWLKINHTCPVCRVIVNLED